MAICAQPTPHDRILLKQIATEVNKNYTPSSCTTIYSLFKKKKRYVTSGNYLGSIRILFFFDQLEFIIIALREGTSQIDLNGIENLKRLRSLTIQGNYSAFNNSNPTNFKNSQKLSTLKQLRYIKIHQIGINNLTFLGALSKLKEAHFSENQIQNILSTDLPKSLVLLNLRKNRIANIPNLNHLTQIEDLDLSQNRFTDISNLANLKSLKKLTLSYPTPYDSTLAGINVLKTLSNLESLTIIGWNLNDSNLFEGLNKLKFLNLRDNKLTEVKGLSTLTSIHELDLMQNDITDLSPLLPLATNPDFDLLGRPNPLRSCSPEKEDHLRAGIICSDNVFNNMWSSLRRLFM